MVQHFKNVYSTVPAYRQFLFDNGVTNIDDINDFETFRKKIPLTNKSNYLSKYNLQDLCIDGTLDGNDFYAVSSGSTGSTHFLFLG